MAKFVGVCGNAKAALDKCFKKEKEKKRDANFQRAKASDAYVRQKIRERHERATTAQTEDSSKQ
jgi:hypothetical protein